MSVIIHRYNFFLVLRIFKINFYRLCHTVLLTSHHAHITFRDLVFCNWKFVLFDHLPPIPPTPVSGNHQSDLCIYELGLSFCFVGVSKFHI